MTDPKYITFKLVGQTEKTKVFDVLTKDPGDSQFHLGTIKWFGRWRKYAFFPANQIVLEPVCLTDITNFMNQLMAERREARVKK